ncbi:MAG TPA: galactokinase [Pyrinomonadaceae bacterium]|nr:galactokinase [Pyrinomonadaceae bacterium]
MEVDLTQLAGEFRSKYRSEPRFFQAPGRVNLIGEHTDYNEGFVMPFAIDRQTIVAAAARSDLIINAVAKDMGESVSIDLNADPQRRRGTWVDYVEGTARCVADRFGKLRGADLLITSSVPIGAGLSSSAAIEIAVGMALLGLNDIALDRTELAFAGQQVEHQFVGTRSGFMDQFAAVFGKADHAMLLDCRTLDIEHIPVAADDMELIVIDSNVEHNLATSEYNTRREECEAGVGLLKKVLPDIVSLRDVSPEHMVQYAELLPDNIRRRCRHVVSENMRTLEAAEVFRNREFLRAGELMLDSHRSLRDDYEVSCAELDFLVETAREVDGVYGARMTGGGFGGCTVNLVATTAVANLSEAIVESYTARFGVEPDVYNFRPSNGASEVTV